MGKRRCRMARAALLSAVLVMLSCNSGPGSRLSLLAATDMSDMVSLVEAVAIAEAQVAGGVAVEAALEIEEPDEGDPPAYEVMVFVAAETQLYGVEVDARTGAVLEIEVGDDEEDD